MGGHALEGQNRPPHERACRTNRFIYSRMNVVCMAGCAKERVTLHALTPCTLCRNNFPVDLAHALPMMLSRNPHQIAECRLLPDSGEVATVRPSVATMGRRGLNGKQGPCHRGSLCGPGARRTHVPARS